MALNKLQQIQALLMDVIIYCTEEVKCSEEVLKELNSLKERVYKLEKLIPVGGKPNLLEED
jgi:hypothetical protein